MLTGSTCAFCRLWAALQACSRCRGVVVIHQGCCVMHCGIARRGHQPGTASMGPITEGAISKGAPNYLANLILFPGSSLPLSSPGQSNELCVLQHLYQLLLDALFLSLLRVLRGVFRACPLGPCLEASSLSLYNTCGLGVCLHTDPEGSRHLTHPGWIKEI